MLNIVSVLIGLVAFFIALFGLIPFVGWANWFVLPLASVGLVIGLVSRRRSGAVFNLVVLGIAFVRLSIGGGFI